MRIADIITASVASGRKRFSFELLPPLKGDGKDSIFRAIDKVVDLDPAFIDITCHRLMDKKRELPDGTVEYYSAHRRPGTVGISAAIKSRYDIEVVPHMICGGMSRYDIEDALIDLDFLGLNNVMALRGDKARGEDRFTPHPQGHAGALDLVKQIVAMNKGQFVDGEVEECHHSKFGIGVAGYPEKHFEADSLDSDIAHLKEKVDAGAQYVLTQLFFDNSKFYEFHDKCRAAGITVPIVPGLKPLSILKHLTILPETFSISIPEELRDEVLAHADDKDAIRKIGSDWCIRQCKDLQAHGFPFIHFYSSSRTEELRRIIEEAF